LTGLNADYEDVWWAYLAGLIDGEGSFGITKHKANTTREFYFYPYISISNTNEVALRFVKEKLGDIGNLHCVTTKKRKMINYWKPAFQFCIGKRKQILEIIPKILPYLIIKKEHALILLEFCRQREKKGRIFTHTEKGRFKKGIYQINYDDYDFQLFNKLREMNKRGKQYD
jgi:hypothetical protein